MGSAREVAQVVVFERWLPEDPDVEVELLAREPLLLAQQDAVEVAALRDETLVIGMAPTMAAEALELCRRHGFEPRFAPPASDIVMASLLATIGLGVALVPASMDVRCYYLRGGSGRRCWAPCWRRCGGFGRGREGTA